MSKLISLILFLFLFTACSFIPTNNNKANIVTLNPVEQIQNNEDVKEDIEEIEENFNGHRFEYADKLGVVLNDKTYFVDGNSCIYDDYILAVVGWIEGDTYNIEIGSHCRDSETNGGDVNLTINDIPIINQEKMAVLYLAKVYYEFPENFEPTDYLDYLDYATAIEFTDERSY